MGLIKNTTKQQWHIGKCYKFCLRNYETKLLWDKIYQRHLHQKSRKLSWQNFWGARDGALVRALASHQCGPGSNPGVDAICGLSLLLVLSLAPRGFSAGTPVFLSPPKPTSPNSNSTRNQVDEKPLCGCATSKSLFIYLFIYKHRACELTAHYARKNAEMNLISTTTVGLKLSNDKFIYGILVVTPNDLAWLQSLRFYETGFTKNTNWNISGSVNIEG